MPAPTKHIQLTPKPINWKPELVPQGNGKYKVPGVPIFCVHNDRGWECNDEWMYQCVENHKKLKESGFTPRLTIGHNADDPGATEKPAEAFLDNFSYDAKTGYLLADFTDIPESLAEQLKSNRWPGRSVEVNVKKAEIPAVALLGGRPPFLKSLPDMRFSDKKLLYYVDPLPGDEDVEMEEDPTLNHPALQGLTDVERSDFQKFSRLMDLYMEIHSEEDSLPEDGDDLDADFDNEDEEHEMNAEMVRKYTDLEARYNKLAEDYAELRDSTAKLVAASTRAEWLEKYAGLQVPAGLMNPAEEADFTVTLPEDKRQAYFEKVQKRYQGFGPKPAGKDGVADDAVMPSEGSDSEWEQIVSYAEEHKEKYRGDLLRAARDYRLANRSKKNGAAAKA